MNDNNDIQLQEKRNQMVELSKNTISKYKEIVKKIESVVWWFKVIKNRRPKWIKEMDDGQLEGIKGENEGAKMLFKEIGEMLVGKSHYIEGMKHIYHMLPDSVFDYWLNTPDEKKEIKKIERIMFGDEKIKGGLN